MEEELTDPGNENLQVIQLAATELQKAVDERNRWRKVGNWR